MGSPDDAGLGIECELENMRPAYAVSSKKTAVYGGSFDPITEGHMEVISNACALFDKLIVVIAPNYDKPSSAFSPQERLSMITTIMKDYHFGSRVEVAILPEGQYLADFATENMACVLIRGMRDTIDFNAEQKIGDTNRKIAPELKTVYIMPSSNLAVVSSSWAKSLVGFKGWKSTLQGCVHPYVVKKLELLWLKKKVGDVLQKAHDLHIIAMFDFNAIWNTLVETYEGRPYHNLSHIADMLVNFRVLGDKFLGKSVGQRNRTMAELAIIFHDFKRSEEESARYPIDNKLIFFNHAAESEIFIKMVMATKHDSNSGQLSDIYAVIADLDLLVLAGEKQDYDDYAKKIRSEYIGESSYPIVFSQGRLKFLQSMVARTRIFHTDYAEREYGQLARNNMIRESMTHR